MGIFNLDSKFMHYANKFADLMFLNILTLICCIPIITIGASITAMHNVLLKIYRDEESYIAKAFFKSFKENLKQSTAIWLIYLVLILVLVLDFFYIRDYNLDMPKFFQYALYIVAIIGAFSFSWVFILQSRYENKVVHTIRNSFIVGISHFFYSIMMIILAAIPIFCLAFFSVAVPLCFAFGFTLPGLLQTMLYSRVFDKIEGVDRKALKEQQQVDDGWTVELDEEEAQAEGEQADDNAEAVEALPENGADTVSEDAESAENVSESAENGQVDEEKMD